MKELTDPLHSMAEELERDMRTIRYVQPASYPLRSGHPSGVRAAKRAARKRANIRKHPRCRS